MESRLQRGALQADFEGSYAGTAAMVASRGVNATDRARVAVSGLRAAVTACPKCGRAASAMPLLQTVGLGCARANAARSERCSLVCRWDGRSGSQLLRAISMPMGNFAHRVGQFSGRTQDFQDVVVADGATDIEAGLDHAAALLAHVLAP